VRAKYLLLFATIFLFNSINVTGGGERKPFSYYEVILREISLGHHLLGPRKIN